MQINVILDNEKYADVCLLKKSSLTVSEPSSDSSFG
jgi:hypothetical protein